MGLDSLFNPRKKAERSAGNPLEEIRSAVISLKTSHGDEAVRQTFERLATPTEHITAENINLPPASSDFMKSLEQIQQKYGQAETTDALTQVIKEETSA